MSKTILTNAFSAYKAQCEATNQPIIMDEFVFALVPDQDPDAPISANETLPADAHIKGRFSVTKKGMINPDAVVYSIILGTEVGTWDFNWIGLVNSNTNIVGAITHTKIQTKEQADPENNTEGDTLARNIITSYLNASNLTQITVTAEVWQLDFNNRLTAIDERIRIDNMDMYGHASFIQDGWKATSNNGAVSLTAGVAYIAGLRCVNIDAMPINLNGIILPKTIYLEACFMGGINSAWQTTTNIVIADSHPPTRIENGITYYSNPIAIITSIDNITDLRPLDWRAVHVDENRDPHKQYLLKANAATNDDVDNESIAEKHVNLPQFWRVINPIKEKIKEALRVANNKWTYVQASLTAHGATKLSSAINSTSEVLAATPKAVKLVADIANSKITKVQTVLYDNTKEILNNGKILAIDIKLYDELHFCTQYTLNASGTGVIVGAVDMQTADIVTDSLSGRSVVYYLISEAEKSTKLMLIYDVGNGFSFRQSSSSQHGKNMCGVFKIVGIKY